MISTVATRAVGITLLGGFEVRVGDRVAGLATGGQHLVALLALHGRRARSRAAGALWPDSTETRALGCLRTTIWRVNQVAPGLVRGDTRDVDLDPAAVVDVTTVVAALRSALDPAQPLEDLGGLASQESTLLPGWEDPWLEAEREWLHQLRLHALEVTAGRLLAAGSFGRALDLALASLRSDPLRESAHRMVIRIHVAEGNVSEALVAYRACARTLNRELGVGPSAQTTGLLQGLEAARPRPAAAARSVVAQRPE